MNTKPFLQGIAAALAAGGLWFAWNALHLDGQPSQRSNPSHSHTADIGVKASPHSTNSRPILRPPDPIQRFTDFTPEQRVRFARRGHGPGG